MKRNYEIYLMQHVTGSVEDDYETVCFECTGGYSYYECKRKAKEFSKHIGKVNVPGIFLPFSERKPDANFPQQPLDAGLAAVKIVCYADTPESSYTVLYYEYYKDGKVDYKIKFE